MAPVVGNLEDLLIHGGVTCAKVRHFGSKTAKVVISQRRTSQRLRMGLRATACVASNDCFFTWLARPAQFLHPTPLELDQPSGSGTKTGEETCILAAHAAASTGAANPCSAHSRRFFYTLSSAVWFRHAKPRVCGEISNEDCQNTVLSGLGEWRAGINTPSTGSSTFPPWAPSASSSSSSSS